MNINPKKISSLIEKIEAINEKLLLAVDKEKSTLAKVHPDYQKSAANLVHYHTFRKTDLRQIQRRLGNLGLSRFASAQGHILDSVQRTLFVLHKLLDTAPPVYERTKLSIKGSNKLIKKNTEALLGKAVKGRRVRIMVTMPTEAAYDYEMVSSMAREGMNCARINCAHDTPDVWTKIIAHIKRAADENGKEIKIAMDLAGPKIRTGAVRPGPKVKKFRPSKDDEGNVIHPAEILLVSKSNENAPFNQLPIEADLLKELKPGDELKFRDTRKKKRTLKVVQLGDQFVTAYCYKTVYVKTGMEMHCARLDKVAVVKELPGIEKAVILRTGDSLLVTKDGRSGSSALQNEKGEETQKAHISCQLKAVFKKLRPGDPVLFDDGKIEGEVASVSKDHFEVKITRANEKGARLKAEKGMNFPMTKLGVSGLTAKDKKDLEFIVKHADIVNFSFVNSRKDIKALFSELHKLKADDHFGIILKIETRQAFDNLFEILLEAMQKKPIGVMIARGDLAVEAGWDTIGKVQLELLELCGAAHLPVIWATQVLENFAKNGLPSRSEITDVTNSLKAECVMLNKGPYMIDVLELLNLILSDMEDFLEKNKTMLPRIKKI